MTYKFNVFSGMLNTAQSINPALWVCHVFT